MENNMNVISLNLYDDTTEKLNLVCSQIEFYYKDISTSDEYTIISMASGTRFLVEESPDEIFKLIKESLRTNF